MKFYLSSYKLGDQADQLRQLTPKAKIGYIANALDFSTADPARRQKTIAKDMAALNELGLATELIDLKDYFAKPEDLKPKLQELGAVFISGGNVYVLRQAL